MKCWWELFLKLLGDTNRKWRTERTGLGWYHNSECSTPDKAEKEVITLGKPDKAEKEVVNHGKIFLRRERVGRYVRHKWSSWSGLESGQIFDVKCQNCSPYWRRVWRSHAIVVAVWRSKIFW